MDADGKLTRGFSEAAEVGEAAKGIFDALPEDPFGEGEGVEDISPRAREEDSPAAESEESSEDDFDADAAKSLKGEDDEEEEEEAEEEVEAEEDEDEPEDEDDDEDEAEDEEAPANVEDPLVTVKVDGETREIPLSEALAGYSRTASWTRKSQALSEERKQFEAERQQVQQERAALTAQLKEAEVILQSQLPPEPDPSDPQAWIRYQQEKQRLENVKQERANLERKMHEEWQAKLNAHVAEENQKLAEYIPEWRDEDRALEEKKSLANYAVSALGFPAEEVAEIKDHRVVLLLKKAYEYDKLSEKGADVKKKVKSGSTLKPGKRSSSKSKASKSKKREAKSQRDRLRKTGDVHDAARFFHDTLLDDE
jgi:hypothetical protein